MPEIRTIQNSDRRISVIEDPNSAYSRIFIDTVAHDLTTLTPYWTKTFHYNYDGFQHLCTGNAYVGGSGWNVYMAACLGPGQGNMRGGLPTQGYSAATFPWTGGPGGKGYASDSNYQYPATDDGFFRMGIMHLQKGTISCYSSGDGYVNSASVGAGSLTAPRSTANFQFDTYHQSLDFANYPAVKSKTLVNGGGNVMLFPGDRGNMLTGHATIGGSPWMNANDGWTLYGADLTANDAVYSTVTALHGQMQTGPGSTIVWEDSANASLWTISNANPCKPFITRIVNPNTNSPTFYPFDKWNTLSPAATTASGTMNYRLFFIGVDSANSTYWAQANDLIGSSEVGFMKMAVNATSGTAPTYPVAKVTGGGGGYLRIQPSNIRTVNSNRKVFYIPTYDGSNFLAPYRMTFAPTSQSLTSDACVMNYGGSNTYSTFAAVMSTSGIETSNNANPWFHKPMQHTTAANNYVTFWFADQAAGVIGSSGTSRWATRQQRTMITFSLGAGTNDQNLSYHSHYVFPSIYDIPKNYMPVDANGTIVMVPSCYKTQFFKFDDVTGWAPVSQYNTEFRSMGIDSTGRIWGYSMDENNGNIHIIANTIPQNVSVVMSNTDFTYTGTTLSPTATVNAYDYTGARLAANVTLTIDGSTMNFATNSSKTLSLTTSNTTDTIVSLSISGGGVNNIYAAISV